MPMVNGLLGTSKNSFHRDNENLKPIEEFEALELFKKYGFNLGWYTFGNDINVIITQNSAEGSQVYLAEKKVEAESILNKIINESVEQFAVSKQDQKEMFNLLKEHGCCYF